MSVEKVFTITFTNGQTCTHHQTKETEDEWWGFITELAREMREARGGLLVLGKPYGIHRLADTSAIHFGDLEPSPQLPPIGFHATAE